MYRESKRKPAEKPADKPAPARATPAAVLKRLIENLNDPHPIVRRTAAHELGGLRADAASAVPALAAALGDRISHVAIAAAGALTDIGPAAVPALTAALRDPSAGLRRRAAVALRRMGPDARKALRTLRSLAEKDPDDAVRRAATIAAAEIDVAEP